MKAALFSLLFALFGVVGSTAVAQQAATGVSRAAPKLPSDFTVRWNFQSNQSLRNFTGLYEFNSVNVEPGTGKVTGTVDIVSDNCPAKKMPIEGTYDGTSLNVKTAQEVGNCGIFSVDMKRTGGTSFKGTYGYTKFVGGGGYGGTVVTTASLPEE